LLSRGATPPIDFTYNQGKISQVALFEEEGHPYISRGVSFWWTRIVAFPPSAIAGAPFVVRKEVDLLLVDQEPGDLLIVVDSRIPPLPPKKVCPFCILIKDITLQLGWKDVLRSSYRPSQ
jgi:hypothetical protein